jgi:hypothetical protein
VQVKDYVDGARREVAWSCEFLVCSEESRGTSDESVCRNFLAPGLRP